MTSFDTSKNKLAPPKRPLVFVVDDEIMLRASLERFLTRHGYEVKGLSNGYEALYMMDHLRPDILITDLRMPKVDGLKLCRTIHSHTGTEHLPIICMTGIHDHRLLEAAERMGIEYFLLKPFPLDLLLNTLHYLVASRSNTDGETAVPTPVPPSGDNEVQD